MKRSNCPDFPACACEGDACQRLRGRPPAAKVQELARKLIGTCGTELIDEISDLERGECRQLDTLAFACTGCGWWFAAAERKTVEDEWFCVECEKEGRR